MRLQTLDFGPHREDAVAAGQRDPGHLHVDQLVHRFGRQPLQLIAVRRLLGLVDQRFVRGVGPGEMICALAPEALEYHRSESRNAGLASFWLGMEMSRS